MSIDRAKKIDREAKQNFNKKPHKCDINDCNKTFRKRYDLKVHIKRHEELANNKTYKCDEADCGEEFPRKWFLSIHKNKVHNPEASNKHRNNGKQYKCEEHGCDAAFTRRRRLQKHKELVHDCIERPFKCEYAGCGRSYRNNAHLNRHKLTSHFFKEDTEEKVICGVDNCGKIYSNKYTLKQHIDSAHVRYERPNSTKKKSDIVKQHLCDEPGCNASFNRPYRLKNHKLTVHCREKPFKCDYEDCDKSYTNESHLARHKTTSHLPEEISTANEVICRMEGCLRIFSNKYSLKKHMSTVHKEFPFACPKCDAKFKRKSQLHAHKVEIHEEEAPYKCDKCPMMFTEYHLHQKHLKNHKTYHCDCEKVFDKWSELLAHRRTKCAVNKKEHKCTICGKIFLLKGKLTQHSLHVHIPDSQIDLLKCPYLNCKYSYKYKINLNHHMKTYHEKLFRSIKCPRENCEMVFKSNKNLKQHLRTIHDGLPAKIRKSRKPRKDKGKPKKSMASIISGIEISAEEDYKNIVAEIDDDMKEITVLDRLDKNESWGTEKTLKICIKKLEDNNRDLEMVENMPKNNIIAEHKKTEGNNKKIDSQGTNSDVARLSMSSNIANTEENCHEATSFSECSKYHNVSDSFIKLKESKNNLIPQQDDKSITESDNVENQQSSKIALTPIVEDCENENNEILNQNKVPDVIGVSSYNNVFVVAPENVVLEISSEVNLNEFQNIEINNPYDREREQDPKHKSAKILESFPSSTEDVVDKKTPEDTIEISNDAGVSNLNIDSSFFNYSQNSGAVIFDFPELNNFNHSDNIKNNTEVNCAEPMATEDVDDCNGGTYISDEQEIKKRLDVMLKDVYSVVKYLKKDE